MKFFSKIKEFIKNSKSDLTYMVKNHKEADFKRVSPGVMILFCITVALILYFFIGGFYA